MLYNYDQLVIPSFVLYIDNFLCNEGQAYTNTGSPLYPVMSSKYGLQYNIYSAPFRPWVSDSSVSGAYIPSGAYNGNTFLSRASGLKINFDNGQILVTGTLAQLTGLTGNYSVKDYSIRYTSESEDDILFNNKYTFIPKYSVNHPITGIAGNIVTLPAIFIKYEQGTSDSVQFGEGIVNTASSFRCIIVSDNEALLDNILGRIRDKTRKNFPIFNQSQLPYDYYGDLKSGNYNYLSLANNKIGYSYIASAKSAKFPETINLDIGRNLFGGWIDIETETYRNPDAII